MKEARLLGALATLLTLAATAAQASTGVTASSVTQDRDLATGIRQVEDGRYADALLTLDATVKRLSEGKGPAVRGDLARAYVHLGIACSKLGRTSAARAYFRRSLELSPTIEVDVQRFGPDTARVFDGAKRDLDRGSARAGVLAIAASGAGVAGVAAAVHALSARSDQAPSGRGEVVFVDSTPPPGATVSLSRESILATLRVTYDVEVLDADLTVALKVAEGTSCFESFVPVALGAGKPTLATLALSRMPPFSPPCIPPFATTLLTARLSQAGRELLKRDFSVAYSLAP